MLSKEQQKEKNSIFWGGFKEAIRKNMSVTGRRVNWLNYPTEAKELYVRLAADSRSCSFNFDIQCKDDGVREVIWEQMGELKAVLLAEMKDEGDWIENFYTPEGLTISRISWSRTDLNYFKEEDIPQIYAFLKEKSLAFDRFYQEYKDILIQLLD
ncbi:MAG TPA: DUF4268 domain-containing protein [Taishania sp.]|nr:DUF4268 domain-containing protein [Taishania sp.]